MSSRSDVERIMRDAYAARLRGDIDAICRIFADNATFQMAGTHNASPVAIRSDGVSQFRPLIEQMIKTFELSDHQIVSMIVEGSKAAVHWRARIRSTVTGVTAVSDLLDLVEIKDGRIASFVEFCDTALAAQMMKH
jgi:ketosteroid isomerase-like protein